MPVLIQKVPPQLGPRNVNFPALFLPFSGDRTVVCRACDTRYSIYKLEKGIGGCYPIRIGGAQEGLSYRIARSTLEGHAGKF